MQQACARLAYSSTPIGYFERVTIDGERVVLWVSCHSYTQQGSQQIPGAYHGCEVLNDLSLIQQPPVGAAQGGDTDWAAVAVSAGAAALVIGSFWWFMKRR